MSDPPRTETVTLGGGCFWCLEAAYQEIAGVEQVVSGYAGGHTVHPTYEAVVAGDTGHAEVVQVMYDAAIISYSEILDIFWAIHDPTTPDRQGYDVGSEYRSIILYNSERQHELAEVSRTKVQGLWSDPVATEIVPLKAFYPAEDYHQNYFQSHPEQAYCQIVINPKLAKLRATFKNRLKTLSH